MQFELTSQERAGLNILGQSPCNVGEFATKMGMDKKAASTLLSQLDGQQLAAKNKFNRYALTAAAEIATGQHVKAESALIKTAFVTNIVSASGQRVYGSNMNVSALKIVRTGDEFQASGYVSGTASQTGWCDLGVFDTTGQNTREGKDMGSELSADAQTAISTTIAQMSAATVAA